MEKVKAAQYYSILADEVTDISRKEQLALVVRYVDDKEEIREDFLDFATVERITGRELAHVILEHLREWGLRIEDCRGQAYDGGTNMSAQGGVQGIIAEINPKAGFMHCNNHVLNLVVVKTRQIPSVRNANGTVTESAEFLWNSPKRQVLMDKVVEKEDPQQKKSHLKTLCRTRWVERHNAYETFYELYPIFVKALEIMTSSNLFREEYGDWSWDAETKTLANGLVHRVTSFEFIVTFVSTMKVLAYIKPITVKLQKRSMDVIKAYSMINDVLRELKEAREEDETTFSEWFKECEQLANSVGTDPSVPRTVARQKHRCNVPYSTTEEYYRRALFLPLFDHMIEQMSTRFEPLREKVISLFSLVPAVVGDESNVTSPKDLLSQWEDDLPCPAVIDVEWKRWKKKCQNMQQGDRPDSLLKTLKVCDGDDYPNIKTLLRLACTMPVTSVETERANSTLKCLKTKLRNSMTEGRLTSLSILKIHRGVDLDFEAAVNTFASNNPRRMRMDGID